MLKNQMNYQRNPEISCEKLDYETVCTVPDESLTIRQILDRFQKGLPVDGGQPYYYETDVNHDAEDIIDPTQRPDYDIVDAHNDLAEINEKRAKSREKTKAKPSKAEREDEKPGGEAERSEAESSGDANGDKSE